VGMLSQSANWQQKQNAQDSPLPREAGMEIERKRWKRLVSTPKSFGGGKIGHDGLYALWLQVATMSTSNQTRRKKMANTVFHEVYGYIPAKLLKAIKRNNVSPMDFHMLEEECYGDHELIRQTIIARSEDGFYRPLLWT
jgi:hypothetical protein